MKTMLKKAAFAALAIVMLAALVIGCVDAPPAYEAPNGMGIVRPSFSPTIQRATILPDDADIDSFLGGYALQFTPTTPGAAETIIRTIANRDDPIQLVYGTYDLIVTAYLTTDDFDAAEAATTAFDGVNAAAVFTETGIVINATPYPLTIALEAYDPSNGDEDGTFKWVITNSVSGLDTAEMTVSRIGAGAVAGLDPLDLTDDGSGGDNWDSDFALLEGFYYVDFELTTLSGTTKNFRHVLHVYRNMTSTFTYEFTNDHIGILTGTFTPTITYVHPEDYSPELGLVTGAVSATLDGTGAFDDRYILTLVEGVSIVTIQVTNAANVDGDTNPYTNIAWAVANGASFLNGNVATAGTYTINLDAGPVTPFDAAGTLQLTVVGTFEGKPYSTEVIVVTAP